MQNQKANTKTYHSLFKTPQNLGTYNSSDSLKKEKEKVLAALQDCFFNFNERLNLQLY